MQDHVIIAGYQGPRSILTRGLAAFAEASLPSARLVPDVTAQGLSAQALFAGLESGAFTLGYMASGYLTARVPELAVLDVPFSVADRAAAFERLDGTAGALLSDAVARETGLVVLGYWDNGFRHLTNGVGPIRTPADCRGLRVRTLNNQIYQDTMAAIGLEPVVTDVKELVSACETGRVQAQENPLTNLVGFGLDRWHRHVSLTGHIFGIVLLVANRAWFDGLSDQRQRELRAAAQAAGRDQRRLAADEDETCLRLLAERGVSVLGADRIDLRAFRDATAPLRDRVLSGVPDVVARAYAQ